MRDAIRRHNKRVFGDDASAAIRYEDWATARLYGTNFVLRHPTKGIIYSQATRQRVSEMLDWISPETGAVLCRSNRRWDAAIPCQDARVLVIPTIPPAVEPCPLDSEVF